MCKAKEWKFRAIGTHTWLVVMQNRTTTLENSLVISYKLNIHPLQNPVILLLGIYPKDKNLQSHKNLCATQIPFPHPNTLQWVSEYTNSGTIIQWNSTQQQERINY